MNVNIDVDQDTVRIENAAGDAVIVSYHEWLYECREQRDDPVVQGYADRMASVLAGHNLLSQAGLPLNGDEAITDINEYRSARA